MQNLSKRMFKNMKVFNENFTLNYFDNKAEHLIMYWEVFDNTTDFSFSVAFRWRNRMYFSPLIHICRPFILK